MTNAVSRSNPLLARAASLTVYAMAMAIGLLLVMHEFPCWALVGGLPPGAPPFPDFGKDALGQIYFFAQPWHLNGPGSLLIDRRLMPPWGASISMTDSIPLWTVLSKLVRPFLPAFEQTISLYQAASWILQPVAAVFVLRGAGERRLLPAVAVAIMAISMPTFLFRLWQAALSGHWLILVMLGLYFRIVRGGLAALIGAGVLQVMLLLIHPYLMFMATMLLFAAPLTLWLRGDVAWRRAALGVSVSTIAMLMVGQSLGYWSAQSEGGFGYYSLNLIAPVWPTYSGLFPGISNSPADATGGQAAGYQYLGIGLLILIAISIAGSRDWGRRIRRHPGLALACGALTALAVTNWVYIGHFRIAHIPFPDSLLSQMRASGRFFWPTAYMLLIGAAVVTLRRFPRIGIVILLATAAIQVEDAQTLLGKDHRELTAATAYPFDQERLSVVLHAHRKLTVIPTFPCNGGGTPVNFDPLWLASRTGMVINSIYLARETHPQDCLPSEVLNTPVAPGELRIVLPGYNQAVVALAQGDQDCRTLGSYLLCTRDIGLLTGLPAPPIRTLPMNAGLPIIAGSPGADTLLAGWTEPGSIVPGAWSIADSALLGARLSPAPGGAIRVRIHAMSMPSRGAWGGKMHQLRQVSAWAGPERLADWTIGGKMADYDAVVPADRIREKGTIVIELRGGPLTSLLDLGLGTGPRRFGLWIDSISFTPVGQARTPGP